MARTPQKNQRGILSPSKAWREQQEQRDSKASEVRARNQRQYLECILGVFDFSTERPEIIRGNALKG
jgi:hypothetical protein